MCYLPAICYLLSGVIYYLLSCYLLSAICYLLVCLPMLLPVPPFSQCLCQKPPIPSQCFSHKTFRIIDTFLQKKVNASSFLSILRGTLPATRAVRPFLSRASFAPFASRVAFPLDVSVLAT
jgi:hypothetical protein